ncbi:PIN domain-containing protein [Micromonospora sp. WMMA1923]|uniref:PIN domain-containing protein n=1 Tax=Micromonospora sp. WMMA1923 TaxID=3404125 RepID=UPI003B93026E
MSRLASGLQATLELLALSIAGKAAGPGRRPREIVDAVRLDFVGFRAGSAVLDIARTGQLQLGEGVLEQALTALEEGTNSLRERPDVRPPHFGPQVLNQLRSLTGGISTSNVTRVELRQGDRSRFLIDDALQSAVRRTSFEKIAQESTVVGRLHMGDFSPATLRCRIDTYAGSILCDFDSDLRDAVLDAMDQMVMAEGVADLEPNGATIRFASIAELHYGAAKARWGERRLRALEEAVRRYVVALYDQELARLWGRLKAQAQSAGHPLEHAAQTNDLWICATVIRYEAPLLTLNRRHFDGFPGLAVLP